MRDRVKIDIWSDIACPWCYLGKRRFEKALADLRTRPAAPQVDIEYHSYQLHPELPAEFAVGHIEFHARKHGKTLEEVYEANRQLQELGERYDITYNFEMAIMANTHKAHELLHYARAHGRETQTREALFKAHFTDGRHIGLVGQLATIATEAGLDRDDTIRAMRSGDYASAVDADQAAALLNGLTDTIPFYIIGGQHRIAGARMPSKFVELIEQAGRE